MHSEYSEHRMPREWPAFPQGLVSQTASEGRERTDASCAGNLPARPPKAGFSAVEFRRTARREEARTAASCGEGLSPWTRSKAKRIFDCACVLLASPVLLPLMLLIGAAVGLTSRGPILFLQQRAGRNGRNFTIFKFRTMEHASSRAHRPVTTLHNQRFTWIGPFLRRWKLDELPQLLNVLLGHMSLVGPRPRLPEHMLHELACRPGLTGAATIAFAKEESILAGVPAEHLDDYYRRAVLPAKHHLDAEYLARATFLLDLQLLMKTALRRWDAPAAEKFLAAAVFDYAQRDTPVKKAERFAPVREPASAWSRARREAEDVAVGVEN